MIVYLPEVNRILEANEITTWKVGAHYHIVVWDKNWEHCIPLPGLLDEKEASQATRRIAELLGEPFGPKVIRIDSRDILS